MTEGKKRRCLTYLARSSCPLCLACSCSLLRVYACSSSCLDRNRKIVICAKEGAIKGKDSGRIQAQDVDAAAPGGWVVGEWRVETQLKEKVAEVRYGGPHSSIPRASFFVPLRTAKQSSFTALL
jgi:hypothetical protein